MKYLILIAVITPLGCIKTDGEAKVTKSDYRVELVEVDGCEYLIYDGYYSGGIIHKQNCKNHE